MAKHKKHRSVVVSCETIKPKVENFPPPPVNQVCDCFYTKRLRACPKCGKTQIATGSRAVVCMSSGNDIAYFRCRDCEHRWKVSVKK